MEGSCNNTIKEALQQRIEHHRRNATNAVPLASYRVHLATMGSILVSKFKGSQNEEAETFHF